MLSFSKACFGFILTLLHIKVQGWSFVPAVKTTTASSAEREKNQKTCRMPVEFEPEGHSLWAHLVLPTRAGYSRKLRLQMSFQLTTYNFSSGSGENVKGKFNMTVPLESMRSSSRWSSECCKTKASLHVITAYQYPRLITSFLCQFSSIIIRRGD